MTTYIGFHDKRDLPFKEGQFVLIPKGTTIRTTRPRKTGPGYQTITARCNFKVLVNHVLEGMNRVTNGVPNHSDYPVKNPSVRWAGAGGYWHEADINDVRSA